MIDQLYAHGPYVGFIALMFVLGVVLTVAAFAEAIRERHARQRRHARQLEIVNQHGGNS